MAININHTNDTINTSSSTLNLPDITVPPNSSGNVSRLVMSTAPGGATSADGANTWAKIATFTGTGASSRFSATYKLQCAPFGFLGYAEITVQIYDDSTSGLTPNFSKITINQNQNHLFSEDSFMLVQGTAAAGQPIELWAKKNLQYNILEVYEVSKSTYENFFTIAYNDSAAWQASAPTGAVTVLSNWIQANENVSRLVMTTAAGTSGDSGYWTKLATFTPTAASGIVSRFTASYKLTSSYYNLLDLGEASIHVSFASISSGITSTASSVQVLQSSTPAITYNSFMLVQAAASRTSPIELWVRKDTAYQYFNLIEVNAQQYEDVTTVTYNDGAAWQASAPTGATTIASEWAGTSTFAPTFVNGTFTYSTQNGFVRKKDGFIYVSATLAWTAASGTGAVQIQLPVSDNASTPAASCTFGYVSGIDNNTEHQLVGILDPGQSVLQIWYINDNAGATQSQVANMSASGILQFSIMIPE